MTSFLSKFRELNDLIQFFIIIGICILIQIITKIICTIILIKKTRHIRQESELKLIFDDEHKEGK